MIHELISIILIASGRHLDAQRRMGRVEQNAAIDALGNPAVLQLAAHVLQFEEELLLREVQMIARSLRVVPAGHLQQSAEKIDLVFVGEHVDAGHHAAVHRQRTCQLALLYLMVLCQLENVVVHTGRILVRNGVFRQVGSSVVQIGI